MKIGGIFITVLFLISFLQAQLNLQQHYDLGRRIQTSTLEYYGEDKLGSTFFFIDINYDRGGASDTYFEINRYFDLPLKDLALTIQYNDGVFYDYTSSGFSSMLNRIWLGGIQYRCKLGKLTFPMDFLLKRNYQDQKITFQYTIVWLIPLWGEKIWCAGFLDIWSNDTSSPYFSREEKYSLTTEWQFYYQFYSFAVGTEMEIDRGFNGAWTAKTGYYTEEGKPRYNRVFIIPTLFVKWIIQ